MTTKLGTISHGTLRSADLIEAFADELREIAPECYGNLLNAWRDAGWIAIDQGIRRNEDYLYDMDIEAGCEQLEPYNIEDPMLLVSSLIEALDLQAPDFCYFGAHEGDGSDFGFWLSDDAIRDAVHDGEIIAVEDIPSYLLHTSDHGNQTLYAVTLREIW